MQAGWRYLAIIWRRKWIVVPLVILPTAAAFVLSHRQERMYQGTAEVLLQRQNLANALTNLRDPSTDSSDAIRVLETQASVARSINVANLVVEDDPTLGVTADDVLARSKVAAERNADLLEFSVEDPDPAKAVVLTNAYAKAFTIYRRQLDTRAVQTAIRSVNQKLRALRFGGSATLRSTLEEKKEQLDTLQALQTSNATVVNPARAAVQTAPKTKRNVVAGFVLGCALALLVALALESRPRRPPPAAPLPDQRPQHAHTEQLV